MGWWCWRRQLVGGGPRCSVKRTGYFTIRLPVSGDVGGREDGKNGSPNFKSLDSRQNGDPRLNASEPRYYISLKRWPAGSP
ncbi:hypothetical protein TSAR_001610 [Trichomalopsis sarcophagae]|uniref:Uncharacterized protein n=1 Tax=Trichomalopsis sarcophagae TaxID=543379 RepID=A0A232EF69_9HYME|nr:hypothetical protein TSAR_001610 [Trichomalopsis sarcophagae]